MRTILFAAMVLAIAATCHERDEDEERRAAPSRVHGSSIVLDDKSRDAIQLAVAPAREDELPDVRLRYGKVMARPGDELVVTSPMVGRVTAITTVAIGDRVTTGVELARVTPVLNAAERASLGVQSAEINAQVAQARQELALREAELTRARDLARDAIVSQAKLQEAEAAAANARARLVAAQAGSEAHAGATGRTVALSAPADGTLVELDASVGVAVQLGQTVARVLRAGARRVDVAVAITDPATTAYEVLVGDTWAPAHLVSRGTTVADDGNRHDIVELDAAAQPMLGSVVGVRLAIGSTRGVVVPESAVLPGANGDIVFVERTHGTFEPRTVQIAARVAGRVRLAAGVNAGESIVVKGASALRGEALKSSLGGEEAE